MIWDAILRAGGEAAEEGGVGWRPIDSGDGLIVAVMKPYSRRAIVKKFVDNVYSRTRYR